MLALSCEDGPRAPLPTVALTATLMLLCLRLLRSPFSSSTTTPLFRETLLKLLEQEKRIEVLGYARDGLEAVEQAPLLRPDVVTMDIEMPIMDGVAATKKLRELLPQVRVLLVSGSQYADRAQTARAAGASGYLTKSRVADELINSILAIARGENVLA